MLATMKVLIMANIMTHENILVKVIKDPQVMTGLSIEQWNICLKEAKLSGTAGRLAYDAKRLNITDKLPLKVQDQFRGFIYNSGASIRKIQWEMNRVARALKGASEKVILLKGATYIAKDLICSKGRTSVDLDILVAKNRIDWAEEQFLAAGWKHQVINDYDQKFYREYSHELPPLVHPDRHISIDVHHNILPVTSRVKPDIKEMIAAVVKIDENFYVFCDVDIILHSIVHLFQDGEIRSSIRNLLEQHDLYEEFGQNPQFWQDLIPRAQQLGLTRALYYSLKFCRLIFETEIPEHITAQIKQYQPNFLARKLMNFMVLGVISPNLGLKGIGRYIAMNGLYIRSHWLRMPPALLIKHLSIKFYRGLKE